MASTLSPLSLSRKKKKPVRVDPRKRKIPPSVPMSEALTPDQCKRMCEFLAFAWRMSKTQIEIMKKVDASCILKAWNLEVWGRSQLSGGEGRPCADGHWDEKLIEALVELRASGMPYTEIDNMLGVTFNASCRAVGRLGLQDKIKVAMKRRKKFLKSR